MSSWFVNYSQSSNPTYKIICFHPAGGSASQFRTWPAHLPGEISILALQLPGREERFNERKITEFSSLIPIIAEQFMSHLTTPYVIVGHSLGALIGFEIVRHFQLTKQQLPEFLVIAAKEPPTVHKIPSRPEIMDDEWLLRRLKSYSSVPEDLFQFDEFKEIFMPYIRSDFLLLNSYRYNSSPQLKVPVIALHGNEDRTVELNKIRSWSNLTGHSFKLKTFKGGHFFIRDSEKEVLKYLYSFFKTRNSISS